MSDDVIVVGNGLGGCLAALTLKESHPDATVRVLWTQPDRFESHSGLIDVLGYFPTKQPATDTAHAIQPETPVENPFAVLDELPEEHPYQQCEVETIRNALSVFDDAISGYRGLHNDENALTVVGNGRVTPTARYPTELQPGLASTDEPLLLVGFEELPSFDTELAATRLNERLPYDVEGTTVEWPASVQTSPTGFEMARKLDENEQIRARLVDTLEAALDVESRIGLPAMLGVENHDRIRTHLQDELYARPFEIPVGTPSVSGRRLHSRLLDALEAAGVVVERDCVITGIQRDDSTIEGLSVTDRNEEPTNGHHTESETSVESERHYEARAFVLATGGFDAGGLRAERSGVVEPLFDCHVSVSSDGVSVPDERIAWTNGRFFSPQPFSTFGLRVDETVRPRSREGAVKYDNLWAVGGLLGGFDPVLEQSGDGVAIVSGYRAAQSIDAVLEL